MPRPSRKITADKLGRLIYEIRGQRVMLDSDLAAIYGVETKVLNRAVKRNADRFPKDFVFQLSSREWEDLRYQIGTSSGGRKSEILRYQLAPQVPATTNVAIGFKLSPSKAQMLFSTPGIAENDKFALWQRRTKRQTFESSQFVIRRSYSTSTLRTFTT